MGQLTPPFGALELALSAVQIATARPSEVDRLTAMATAAAPDDPEVRSVARRASGHAAWARGDMAAAADHLRRSVAVADGAGLSARAAEARGSLGFVLAITGDGGGALREIDRAVPVLTGIAGARIRMQRALVLDEMGRFDEAVRWYAQAMTMLNHAGGDPKLEADLRNNRSIVLSRLGAWRAAGEDLDRATELYESGGYGELVAATFHNRATVAAARGDVPTALRAFDEAQARYRRVGRSAGLVPVEKAEVLLSVRLAAEARAAAAAAAAEFRSTGNATDLARARLVLARAALAAGDTAVAQAEAEAAQRSYGRLRRPGWVALARSVRLRATWEHGDRGESLLRFGRRTAVLLTEAGWLIHANDAQLTVARLALDLGHVTLARRVLSEAAQARRRGPADMRARAWHAEALLRLTDGDRRGAERALRAGIAVLETFRAGLGATELRAEAAGEAGELATLGARLAVESGRPAAVFDWAERWRASALQRRSALPPDDPALRDDLAELRQVVADIGAAATDGRETASLVRRQARLEESVRTRSRHAEGSGADATTRPTLPVLRRLLGDAVLVEYLTLDRRLRAVVVAGRHLSLHDLGPIDAVTARLDELVFGLRRLAYSGAAARSMTVPDVRTPSRAVTRVTAAVERAAAHLDALLLEPLALPDTDLVVVPTGVLHAVPWGVLPRCAGRTVSVSPSAALWARARQAPEPAGPTVLAAGPGLPHADGEVEALAADYPDATRFTGETARVSDVTTALDGAGIAHIAAHGHLRIDNPLFSALHLADGPLTVYDLERLSTPPDLVVLSACDTGLPAVRAGDEQLGLASALLAMGTTSLVAAVLPVDDAVTSALMTIFHRHLRHGMRPAAALAGARADLPPAAAHQAAGFLCFGAG